MVNAQVVAYGWYTPSEVLDNKFFVDNANNPYKVYEGRDEGGNPVFSPGRVLLDEAKILKSTGGIQERRRVAPDEYVVDLVEKAFRKSGFDAKDLDGIIIGSISDRIRYPSDACRVQQRIGARECIDYTADVGAACSSFSHALNIAKLIIQESGGYYLVAGVEILTRLTDYEELNCDLFGDGCGLVVLGPTKDIDRGILATHFLSDVSGIDFIYEDKLGKLRMPSAKMGQGGLGVFEKATRGMVGVAHLAMNKVGIKKEEVDFYIPHQANGRIINRIEKEVDPEKTGKIIRTLERFGNMSSATKPVAYAEAREKGIIKPGNVVVWTDMGSGLAFGSVVERV